MEHISNDMKGGLSEMLKRIMFLFTAFVIAASARPVTPVGLETLASQADAIVVASLRQGSQSGAQILGTLDVKRVLKGNLAPGSSISVEWQGTAPVIAVGKLPAINGLWFLRGSGMYSILPKIVEAEDIGDLVFRVSANTPSSFFQANSTDTAIDRILLEFASSIASETRPDAMLAFMLSLAYKSTSGAVYDRLLQSPSGDVQAAAFAALINGKNTSAVEKVEARLPLLGNTAAAVFLANSLEETRTSDQSAVLALGRIATGSSTKDTVFARYAARAVATIHTPSTLPFLTQMLDSADKQVRTAAVNGLSAFVMNLPIRTRENFASMAWMKPEGQSPYFTEAAKAHVELGEVQATREMQTLSFWKTWWAENRARISAQP